jgi:uncharacterized protein (TIGR00730 family)
MQNIAVFCGSKYGQNPKFLEETIALCTLLGQYKKHVIYGGGNAGLMGTVANIALENGATVTGIIPQFLNTQERIHEDLTTLIVTETMHERKKLLFEKCDTAIILPGGFGTLDELFEMLTWNQLGLHQIKVVVLNVAGFYDHLQQHIQKMYEENFLYILPQEQIVYISTGAAIEAFL